MQCIFNKDIVSKHVSTVLTFELLIFSWWQKCIFNHLFWLFFPILFCCFLSFSPCLLFYFVPLECCAVYAMEINRKSLWRADYLISFNMFINLLLH